MSVYRRKNACRLAPFVEEARRHHWEIRLWALDSIEPALQSVSRGVGPGSRPALLNRLITPAEWSSDTWVVVLDDDVRVEQGSLALFLGVAAAAGLSIAQPAHGEWSFLSHAITLRDPLAIARLTTFVEQGPIFTVRHPWTGRLFPFPQDYGMGWGVELAWSDLRKDGARLGVVDIVPVRHLAPPAVEYDDRPEKERVRRLLRERDLKSYLDMQRTLAVWRPWQSRAPWLSG